MILHSARVAELQAGNGYGARVKPVTAARSVTARHGDSGSSASIRVLALALSALCVACSPQAGKRKNDSPLLSEDSQNCVTIAFKAYLPQSAAILSSEHSLSIQAQLAHRRLVEGYCAAYLSCFAKTPGFDPGNETLVGGIFASCIDQEERSPDGS